MMEEIPVGLSDDRSYDSFNEEEERPAERWAPLGAANPSPSHSSREMKSNSSDETVRLQQLEEEQEQLNAALLALTTHFAQVQFRLQQICKAPLDQKEQLLQELDDFAAKGAPDLMEAKSMQKSSKDHRNYSDSAEQEANIQKQRVKQLQLISQLKDQLEDLERFAYEAGEGDLPSNELMEKQRVIIESLQSRMDLRIDRLDGLSHDELQLQVDQALKRLINPIHLKDQLVEQLKTQVEDLHRFIDFLQADGVKRECSCANEKVSPTCPVHNPAAITQKHFGADFVRERKSSHIDKTMELLQLYVLSQLGCQSQKFRKNQLKTTSKGSHWGDLRAALEIATDRLIEVAKKQNWDQPATLTPSNSDDEEVDDVFSQCSEELLTVVRKEFCPALKNLVQHGVIPQSYGPNGKGGMLGCFPDRSRQIPTESPLHAWDIIVKYYDMKHGKEFSDAPIRKLSQSFNLDSIGGRAVTSKQLLLSTIDSIISSHQKLKRSPDAHFKAFVSAALNHKKLASWLRMILKTKEILDENYCSWSYLVKTGFDDAYRTIEKLNEFPFNLPVDFAVRPFQNMRDAF